MENKEAVTIEQNLQLLRSLKPDPYWQGSLKSLLLKKNAGGKRSSWFLTFRWQVSIALALLLVFLTGGTSVFAQGSVPGDLLYPVKRGMEDFRLVFAGSEDRFIIQQELAEKRIAELKEITLSHRYQATQPAITEVEASVSKFSQGLAVISTKYQTLKEGGKNTAPIKETLEQLVPTIEKKQAELEQIEESLPEPARAKVGEIRNSLEDLATQVRDSLEMTEEPKSTTENTPASNLLPNQTSVNEGLQNTP